MKGVRFEAIAVFGLSDLRFRGLHRLTTMSSLMQPENMQ